DYLDISSFEFDYDYFFTEAQVASIPPSESEEITIYFIPDSIGSFSGIMTINSNDDDDPAVDVTLYGTGEESPLLLSFSTLIDTLAPNSVNSYLLTLSNTGNVSLDYQINHDIEWLTISPENGTIPAYNTELIQVNISTLFMNYGEYNGTIEIETSVGVFYVEVTIIVAELNIDNDIAGIPHTFKVHENFPNPFNPVTKVQIDVPEFGHAIIQVHDVSGRLITTLVNEELRPGFHSIQWNGKNQLGESVSSGVYILNVRFENLNISQKMLLVK
ncbi:MAG: T9SS type A sorting domain-containing protein, partial [Candidatus Marinimicrobia bacterium]|nr:T9SS type A sorting domain-containing protein [Candidatus Neomarinimicrobiota bacterium]